MEQMHLNPNEVLSLIRYGRKHGFVAGVIFSGLAYTAAKVSMNYNIPTHKCTSSCSAD